MKHFAADIFDEFSERFVFWEMYPLFRKIDYKYSKAKNIFDENIEMLENKLKSHYKDYDESVIRDFCDTLISAKNDALREGKESAPYLNDGNLTMILLDLFFGGIGTTQNTFRWILFLMTYYPEVLKKMKQEIESQVGDRIPTHEDRNRCHYVVAVISESLRLRNVGPMGNNHKAVVTSKLGIFIFNCIFFNDLIRITFDLLNS